MKTLTALALFAALAFVSTGFSCGTNKDGTPKTEEQAAQEKIAKVASALSVVAQGEDAGITTVHALRVAGKIRPDRALSLARDAAKANDVNEKIAQFLLDSDGQIADSATVLDNARQLLDLAKSIESVTVSDNGNTQLVFDLGVAAADQGLQVAVNNFGSSLPKGFKVSLTDETRARLKLTTQITARNRERLNASVAELEGIVK